MRSDGDVLLRARLAAGLSQVALAAKAGTSRTSLSAYEHGRKSPTLATAARIARAAGFDLTISPRITFRDVAVGRGRSIPVPDALPRLAPDQAFATVQLPIHLNWSDRDRRFDLHDRRQRARVYEIVLREGAAEDVLAHIDGALLVDLWDELVLPREVRIAWDDVVRGPLPDRVAS
jgi:transcriptional regulator with XRE-family HTH domain